MNTSSSDPDATGLAAARSAWRALQGRWSALALRERRLLALAAAVLGAYGLWALAIAPAWRTLDKAPAQLDAQQRQLQQMQLLARETLALRSVAPVPLDQAQAALGAATERLGPPNKLSLQGDRALLRFSGLSAAQLAAWLAEARAGARARVIEASLTMSGPGVYDGSLTLALGGSP
jgi:general secretion pathway protein M